MKIQQPGFLIWVEKYDECVAFYSEILGLHVRHQKEGITNFRFGEGYIILEKGTPAPEEVRKRPVPPFIVRLNVVDVDTAAAELKTKGVEVQRASYAWGETGDLRDPDGNLIQLCKFK